MAIPLPIETERLLVRTVLPDIDTEAMVAVYCDPEVMRYVAGGPLADASDVRTLLDGYVAAQEARGFSSWALVERASGDVVGDVGFGVFEPTGDVELGYTLARAVWGRGYATEAAGACLETGLAHLDVERIVALADVENTASHRVAERLGMARAGIVEAHGRPHVLFAATR